MSLCSRFFGQDSRLLGFSILALVVRPPGLARTSEIRRPPSMNGSTPTSGVRGSPCRSFVTPCNESSARSKNDDPPSSPAGRPVGLRLWPTERRGQRGQRGPAAQGAPVLARNRSDRRAAGFAPNRTGNPYGEGPPPRRARLLGSPTPIP